MDDLGYMSTTRPSDREFVQWENQPEVLKTTVPVLVESLYQATKIFLREAPALENTEDFKTWDVLPSPLRIAIETSPLLDLEGLEIRGLKWVDRPKDDPVTFFPHPGIRGFVVFCRTLEDLIDRLRHASGVQCKLDDGSFTTVPATVVHELSKVRALYLYDNELGVFPSTLRIRLDRGLARAVQLDLLAMVFRLVAEELKYAVLHVFERHDLQHFLQTISSLKELDKARWHIQNNLSVTEKLVFRFYNVATPFGSYYTACSPGDPHRTLNGFSQFLGYLENSLGWFKSYNNYFDLPQLRMSGFRFLNLEAPREIIELRQLVTFGPRARFEEDSSESSVGEHSSESLNGTVLHRRWLAGIARITQFGLLAVTGRTIAKEVKDAMREALMGKGDKHEKTVCAVAAVADVCRKRRPLVEFLVNLRAESVEARIRKYLVEK
ncbi:hypothetical protein BJ508DRAFT_366530 [Ascobolus immersus RN42]|uniref:Uncharacterized protein n=1 Tax=Ascobolus immersus RN42 TaxID=1160509 RepID=A0A3N4HIX0_ASCIM|nr:hypothetical protein BJ508DRAFT_366530 [Ascobolus immersus RN42]